MTNAELLEASPKKPYSSLAKEARLKREAEFDAALLKINSPVVTSNTSTRRKSHSARRNSKVDQEPPLADAMEAYFCARLRQMSTRKLAAVDAKLEERLSNQSPRVLSLAQQLFSAAEQELGITEADGNNTSQGDNVDQNQQLQAALCDLSGRLHQQDHGASENSEASTPDDAMDILQGALVSLAEENMALQERVLQLEHIALAAALAPAETNASSTPPESPPVHSTPQTGGTPGGRSRAQDRTPPSPLAASRLQWADSTPEVRSMGLDDDTPSKPPRLALEGDLDARVEKYMKESNRKKGDPRNQPQPRKVDFDSWYETKKGSPMHH